MPTSALVYRQKSEGRANVGIGPYGCAKSKETEGCSRRADVGIGPYGMVVVRIL